MPTEINKATFNKMIEEDIAWLKSQPGNDGPSTEKGHILIILKNVSTLFYDNRDYRRKLTAALQAIISTWNDPNLDLSETASEMATIAQQTLSEDSSKEP